jgi:hypothetical protein
MAMDHNMFKLLLKSAFTNANQHNEHPDPNFSDNIDDTCDQLASAIIYLIQSAEVQPGISLVAGSYAGQTTGVGHLV